MFENALTEQANPASSGIDALPTEATLRVVNSEDGKGAEAVASGIPATSRPESAPDLAASPRRWHH
jgi:N-acetylmuramic acid 6-phosphate (MurNAc-6-P) etherase